MSLLTHMGLYDESRAKKALDMLLVDRKNEFRELAGVILRTGSSKESIKNWEFFILNFSLDVSEAFKIWSGQASITQNSDLKALTILRQLARGKTQMNQMTHFLNIAYSLAEEFKVIYRRIE